MKNRCAFIFFAFFPLLIRAQPSEEKLKHRYQYTYYKYKFYGSFDFVRLAGVGFEYRNNPFFGIDCQVGYVYPNGLISRGDFSANDYFNMKGGFISFTAKKYFGVRKHVYIGFYNAFHYYGYNKKWAFPGVDYPYYGDDSRYYPPKELRDRRTFSFTLSPCIGGVINIKGISIEPYLAVGPEFTFSSLSVFEQQKSGNPAYAYTGFPYNYSASTAQLNVVCGIKIGLCKKPTTIYSSRYYIKKVKIQIRDIHRDIINLYRFKAISAQQLDGYKRFEANAFINIKNYSRKSVNDTNYLNNAIIQSVQDIENYYKTNFKR